MVNIKKLNKIGLGIFALSFLLLTACELEPSDTIDPTASELLSAESSDKLNLSDFSTLPEGYENRTDPKLNLGSESARQLEIVLNTHPEYREMIRKAMDAVSPSTCGPTDFNFWLDDELEGWDEVIDEFGNTIFDYALIIGMLDFPTYDALLFENSSENQYFGVNGEYTQRMTKTFKDLRRFWDIPSDDIVLAAMHGNMLLDREKVIRIDKILYGDSQAMAEYYADLTIFLLENFPQYRNGDHPVFTLNAFALNGFNFPPYGDIPSKIVMGDGIMEAYEDLGFGDVAPQAILAHEFAHQIQFKLDLFTSPISDPAEATRRTELMADAYAAYYLSHARGATMQWKRVQQFLQVFFVIGDCGFASSGHHGTPIQRMAAAEWGYQLADNAKKQGMILSSQEFADLFDAQLPILVAP
ncbi:hypothetical protein SYJ56_24010 [Algoriphagus sp. D3-2-R+10]|uniref:hypothetical protein n=1 Tax=Algoriphagus aurantiacus TaxID=3103948 RepID=UPI002B3E5C38|nr:hypothetical protein [Algoriphagus sp. D3-2-R+10]MEB2778396.1 hypothetical protein [Algoriphagus sp. D3-2-R+10]